MSNAERGEADMTRFAVGDRVKYQKGNRNCKGVIVRVFPGYRYHARYDDEEDQDISTCYAVKVDEIPEWWGYVGRDVFAPEEGELERE